MLPRRPGERNLAAAAAIVRSAAATAAIIVDKQQDDDNEQNPGAIHAVEKVPQTTHILSPPFIAYTPYYDGRGKVVTVRQTYKPDENRIS